MVGCAGEYLAIRQVLQATEAVLTEAETAQENSPARVSCSKVNAIRPHISLRAANTQTRRRPRAFRLQLKT